MRRFLVILIAVLLLLCSSCAPPQSSSLPPDDPSKIEKSLIDKDSNAVLDNEEFNKTEEYIDGIELKYDPWLSQLDFFNTLESSKQLIKVGVRGVPVLLYKCSESLTSETKYSVQHAEWYRAVTYAILRINRTTENYPLGVFYPTASIVHLWDSAEADLKECFSSSKSDWEKFGVAVEYGLLAIPFVLNEIEKGHTEYESFFTSIGLHLTDEEDAMFRCSYGKGTWYLSDKEFLKNADGFDYKAWLKKNADNLNLLYGSLNTLSAKFAEFEAEYKKDISGGLDTLTRLTRELKTLDSLLDESSDRAKFDEYSFKINSILTHLRLYGLSQFALEYGVSRACTADKLRFVISHTPQKISEVCDGEAPFEEKCRTLRAFGYLCLPELTERIKSGQQEYEDVLILLGAHLTNAQWSKISHATNEGERIQMLNENSEVFNYTAWLSENEEDLDNLFKYLDAYCAEYEAAQE